MQIFITETNWRTCDTDRREVAVSLDGDIIFVKVDGSKAISWTCFRWRGRSFKVTLIGGNGRKKREGKGNGKGPGRGREGENSDLTAVKTAAAVALTAH